jgi:hypothetical protein
MISTRGLAVGLSLVAEADADIGVNGPSKLDVGTEPAMVVDEADLNDV